jgi:hypothetical protein
MVFAGMAAVDGFTGISPGPVGTYHFPAGGIFQVNQLFSIKFDVAHSL